MGVCSAHVKPRKKRGSACSMASRLSEEEYHAIYQYLVFKRYPNGLSKNEKRMLRRRAKEHYRMKNGRLLYSAVGRSRSKAITDKGKSRAWKIVVKTEEERKKILQSCHSGSGG